jgi:hypothetical protein
MKTERKEQLVKKENKEQSILKALEEKLVDYNGRISRQNSKTYAT